MADGAVNFVSTAQFSVTGEFVPAGVQFGSTSSFVASGEFVSAIVEFRSGATFQVSGQFIVPGPQYATASDLATYLPPIALQTISLAQQNALLMGASAVADGYLIDQYVLPIQTPYPRDLIRAVCFIAAYDLIAARGFNPEVQVNQVFKDRHDQAITWLEKVQRGELTPSGIKDSSSTGTARVGGVQVTSRPVRGWTEHPTGVNTPPVPFSIRFPP